MIEPDDDEDEDKIEGLPVVERLDALAGRPGFGTGGNGGHAGRGQIIHPQGETDLEWQVFRLPRGVGGRDQRWFGRHFESIVLAGR